MALTIEILRRADAAPYAELFASCPEAFVQLSLQWADVIAPISPDEPYFIVARDPSMGDILGGMPLYHFCAPLGGVLTSVPHAGPLGGVVTHSRMPLALKKEVYGALRGAALGLAEELGCVSVTIITNPFTDDAALYTESSPPDYTFNNFTQAIDITDIFKADGSYNTGKSRYNNHINKNLAKAGRAGLSVEWAVEADFDSWYDIHLKRHAELSALPLPKPLLKGILEGMAPAGMGGLAVVRCGERVVGGCFYIWNRVVADAFIMSGDSAYFDHGINHIVTDFALREFKGKGLRLFNWQSCKRPSGVYDFKVRWGSREYDYAFLTWTLPGFDRVLRAGTEEVSKGYAWHYVAPFEAIERGLKSGVFDKV